MLIILFITGASLASFITLCAQRLATHELPWLPRHSYCNACQQQLAWWQLIPIVGYCLQAGRCHYCHQRITCYFPLVELLTAVAFSSLFCLSPLHDLVIAIAILTLVFISTTDMVAQFVYPLAYCGLFPLALITNPSLVGAVEAAVLAICLHCFATRTRALGSGDVELLVLLWIIFGGITSLIIIQISSVIMLACFALSKQKRLPFIPAISLAVYLILFYQQY
ncbi:prepilin peptidase [Limosilactobacillus caccae]|uniref:prepilin peptidase n=1 Tax=Limosilactobacillus caccae TaxID=1926284 RepID=UPI0009703778|nr:A24 family peptidase [Limosilactobacillus caccae]